MAIQGIGSSYNTATTTQSTTAAGGKLGKDAFLQILVSQLKISGSHEPHEGRRNAMSTLPTHPG